MYHIAKMATIAGMRIANTARIISLKSVILLILKFIISNNLKCFVLPLDFFFLGVGDDEEVVAMEFFGSFDEGIEFAFSSVLGGHIVADLYELFYF